MRTKRLDTIITGALLGALLLLGRTSFAHADEISISAPTVTGSPGDTITVFGNLTNNTSNALYFGNDAVNLTAPSTVATASDDIILNGLLGTGPTSIAAGATLTSVDLFSVQILGGSGTYSGNSFQLIGGTDAVGCANGSSDCNNLLGTANFSIYVAPVPVPAAGWLMLSGLGGLAAMVRKKRAA
ncbi:MAG: VPLPA-CTERM sorting domain-containing protein [Steroidobacteraceae bacterium]